MYHQLKSDMCHRQRYVPPPKMANCGAIVLTLLPPSPPPPSATIPRTILRYHDPLAATIPPVNPIWGLLLHILLYKSQPFMEETSRYITANYGTGFDGNYEGEPDSAPPGIIPPANPTKECCNKSFKIPLLQILTRNAITNPSKFHCYKSYQGML